MLAAQMAPAPLMGTWMILLVLILLALGISAAVIIVARSRRREPRGFPVFPIGDQDGPGTYRITGVDRQTRADREITIDAASRENAIVKAELDGIVVTRAEFQPRT
jgi:hypothetical protein